MTDSLILELLKTLDLALLSEVDALAFMYRHASSLGTAAQIARLIGYDKAEIGAVLHKFEALGFIVRSRDSQGIRLYRLSALTDSRRQSSLLDLMSLTHNRTGRLLLVRHLKRTRQELYGRPQ